MCVWIEVKKFSCLIESALFGKDVHVSLLFLVLDAFVLNIIPKPLPKTKHRKYRKKNGGKGSGSDFLMAGQSNVPSPHT